MLLDYLIQSLGEVTVGDMNHGLQFIKGNCEHLAHFSQGEGPVGFHFINLICRCDCYTVVGKLYR